MRLWWPSEIIRIKLKAMPAGRTSDTTGSEVNRNRGRELEESGEVKQCMESPFARPYPILAPLWIAPGVRRAVPIEA